MKGTLCFLLDGENVLLALKKRGLGKDKWNGVGGKQEPGEKIHQTAIRETKEEIGVEPKNIKHMGELHFTMTEQEDWDVSVFLANEWEGQIIETEEMRPKWYSKNGIPFNQMWDDDRFWLPHVLDGKRVDAHFVFKDDKVIDYKVNFLRDKG